MKKLFFLVAIMAATTVSALNFKTDLEFAELKAALPSGDTVLPHFPDETHQPLVWRDDTVNYRAYKLHQRSAEEICDSTWAAKNETYKFILYRLSADSVMNAPFVTVKNNSDAEEKRCNGRPNTVSYSVNTTTFSHMYNLEQLCEQMKTYNTSELWRDRPRPYKFFGDWYKGQKYAVDKNDKSSYPSGHGYFAGLFGACLRYIDPTNTEKIDNMVDEWLHCRLLLGAHWESDLPAGKQLGDIAYNIAINHAAFRDTLEAAKEELYQYRMGQASGVPMPAKVDPDHAGVYYTTFYDGTNKFMLPAGVEAYIATLDVDALKLTKIAEGGEVIPANTAVILKATSAAFNLIKSDGEAVSFTAVNNLIGADAAADAPTNCYVLSGKAEDNSVQGVGFYQFSGRLSAHKAYIVVGGSSIIKRLRFVFQDDQTTTDCKAVSGQKTTVHKMLKDGQLIIIQGDKKYNAQGKEIQ